MSICLLIPLFSCAGTTQIETDPVSPVPTVQPTPVSSADPTDFAKASQQFGLDLWNEVRSEPGNLVISPASISLALTMTAGGARGETAAQMLRVLHLEAGEIDGAMASVEAQLDAWNQGGTDYQLLAANRLFGERTAPFEKEFLDLTAGRFKAPLEPVDFIGAPDDARKRINAWVSEQTQKHIPELLPQGSVVGDTRLVLTNALYFEGDWQQAFEVSATSPAAFRAAKGEIEVPMLHQTSSFGYAKLDDVQVLELPYAGGHLAMDIFLPLAVDGIAEVEDLSVEDTARWLSALRPTQVQVALPKLDLQMDKSIELKGALTKLGMPIAFDSQADFTGIAQLKEPFYIDEVYHQTSLTLDEEGTVAAAATGVVMSREAAVVPMFERFTADHPFLFLIRDLRSGSVLFLGRVANPSAG